MNGLPRSPVSALPGERLPGIGHNQGPSLDTGRSWRAYAWKQARTALLPKLPLEVIRRRVRRAQELGLDYPQYASILLGTGRDIVAFLFTCDGMGLRLERGLEMPGHVVDKLRRLNRCDRLLGAQRRLDPPALAAALAARNGIDFAGAATLPGANEQAGWGAARAALRDALKPLRLPSDAVVLVGTEAHERDWAEAAQLARFLPAEGYFGG